MLVRGPGRWLCPSIKALIASIVTLKSVVGSETKSEASHICTNKIESGAWGCTVSSSIMVLIASRVVTSGGCARLDFERGLSDLIVHIYVYT